MVREPIAQAGRCGRLEWAARATPFPGQRRSGDAFLVQEIPTGTMVAVVDGLGHGEEAAEVAEVALASLRATAGAPLLDCLTACHGALRGTRGAALTLAALDLAGGRLAWVAVGNVEAAVVRPDGNGRVASRSAVPLRGGVVGGRLPPLRESSAPLAAGDVVVWATDGLAPAFLDAIDPSLAVADLARLLHDTYARADDDALALAVRYEPG